MFYVNGTEDLESTGCNGVRKTRYGCLHLPFSKAFELSPNLELSGRLETPKSQMLLVSSKCCYEPKNTSSSSSALQWASYSSMWGGAR